MHNFPTSYHFYEGHKPPPPPQGVEQGMWMVQADYAHVCSRWVAKAHPSCRLLISVVVSVYILRSLPPTYPACLSLCKRRMRRESSRGGGGVGWQVYYYFCALTVGFPHTLFIFQVHTRYLCTGLGNVLGCFSLTN